MNPTSVLRFVLACALLPAPALAKYCGDDLEGRRVPCACGDVVTSDTRLLPEDPVVSERCSYDGLTIAAGVLADSLTLDLNGLSIRGDGYGVGIRIESGGASGVILRGAGSGRGYGEIIGFSNGVTTPRFGAVARVEGLEVKGARDDGLVLRGRGIVLIDVTASSNGGDGLRLTGFGGRLSRVQAIGNAGNGLSLASDGVVVEATAENNRGHGMTLQGHRSKLIDARARFNGGIGVVAPRLQESSAQERLHSDGNGRGQTRFRTEKTR